MPPLISPARRKALGYARRITQRGRPLPGLIVAGAQKAGTSSLFTYLADHPQLRPSYTKEVHYFDLNFDRGTGWYRSQFPRLRHESAGSAGAAHLAFEASPYYLAHPLAPYRIRGLLPEVKLIVLLRNPVDRALSHYYHEVNHEREPLPLRDALSAEAERVAPDLAQLASTPLHRSRAHQRYSYLSRGLYADQLELWFSLFPREQILVLDSAELFASTAGSLERIYRFLGIPAAPPAEYEVIGATGYTNTDEAIRSELAGYFKPHNERLWRLLGEDWGWDRAAA